MGEDTKVTKARATELVKELSVFLTAEKAAYEAYQETRRTSSAALLAAKHECDGVIFEAGDGTQVYLGFAKGGGIVFRKCLPKQVAKAKEDGRLFVALPKNVIVSSK